jgi:trehalose-phosphatase
MTREVEPTELAELLRPVLPSALVGFDVDGVLAPIVEHADDARLLDGTNERLTGLAARTEVAIVSGRSLDSLERLFGFPTGLHVVGSHGLELRDAPAMELDDAERATFEQLEILGTRAVNAAGDGAWLEYKPASVVLHTRSADAAPAAAAVDALTNLARNVSGAQVKEGHEVVELLARSASKGEALVALADRLGRSPLVFLGDDVTDEDAFALMTDGDVSVRVGPGDTAARYRLADPDAVAAFVDALTD